MLMDSILLSRILKLIGETYKKINLAFKVNPKAEFDEIFSILANGLLRLFSLVPVANRADFTLKMTSEVDVAFLFRQVLITLPAFLKPYSDSLDARLKAFIVASESFVVVEKEITLDNLNTSSLLKGSDPVDLENENKLDPQRKAGLKRAEKAKLLKNKSEGLAKGFGSFDSLKEEKKKKP